MEWLSRRRLGLVFGLVLTLVSLAALISFAPQDPTLTNLRFPKDGVGNWLGYPGALAAGSLVEAFGWAALVVPLAVLYWTLCVVGRPRSWMYALQTIALALVAASWAGEWSDAPGLGLASPGLIGWSGGQWTRSALGPWLGSALLTMGFGLALWHQFYAPHWRAALSDVRTLGRLFTREGWRHIATWLRGEADRARGAAPALGLMLMAPISAAAWVALGVGSTLRRWIVAPVARVVEHIHMSAASLRRIKARAAAATLAPRRVASPAPEKSQAVSGRAFDAWMTPELQTIETEPQPGAAESWISETGAPPRPAAHPSARPIEPVGTASFRDPSAESAPFPIPRMLERQQTAPVASQPTAPQPTAPQPTGAERLADQSHVARSIAREVESLRPAPRPELPPAGAGAERWEQLLRRYRENLDLDWDERSWRAKEEGLKGAEGRPGDGSAPEDHSSRRNK